MLFARRLWMIVAALAMQSLALAQAPDGALAAPTPLPPLITSLAHFQAPYDPLELVPEGAQPVENAEDRAATVQMLETARDRSNVRMYPYDLKTTFTSYGSSSSDGQWNLEDTSPSRGLYRWSAQGPSYSGVFLHASNLLSSDRPSGGIPLRLAQAREAMFRLYEGIGRYASLRVASADLNGMTLRCVLVARGIPGSAKPSFSSGRSFDEEEYCVDTQTGLLVTYSPVPGLYVRYDYSNALHFHDQVIPSGFTISENGRAIIEAKTESVTDSPDADQPIFRPAGLSPLGVGRAMDQPAMIRANQASAVASPQVVVLHGMVSRDGRLDEREVIASTDPSLNDGALKSNFLRLPMDTQPGATPTSREVILTIEFIPSKPCGDAQSGSGVVCGTQSQLPPN